MEEAADDAIENGATSGAIHLALLRPLTPTALFHSVHAVLLSHRLRLRSSHDGRNRRTHTVARIAY